MYVAHFPAWAIEQVGRHATPAPLVVYDRRQVVALNAAALAWGLEMGMGAERAQSLCPEAALRARDPSAESYAWEHLTWRLYRVTPWIEAPAPPFVYFRADQAEARRLAASLRLPACIAACRSIAMLGALKAVPGAVLSFRQKDEEAFLACYPVSLLHALGFEEDTTQKLMLLGLKTLGLVRGYGRRHLELAFGKDGGRLYALLHPGKDPDVALFQPPPLVREDFTLEQSLCEPGELQALLALLVAIAVDRLGERLVGQFRLEVTPTGRPALRAARFLRNPTCRRDTLLRFAERLLEDLLRAHEPEVQELAVELAGLRHPAFIQKTLFDERRRKVQDAVGAVHRRYPGAIRRAVVRTGAHFHEDQQHLGLWT